jgi:hypothetical protein
MKNILYCFLLMCICSNFYAQNINFSASVKLLDTRTGSLSGFNEPFLPFDYNKDGSVDFIGVKDFDTQIIYKGSNNFVYSPINITQGFARDPLKIMDFDRDGDDDIIMENYINLYQSRDSFVSFIPDLNFDEKITEVADFDQDGFNDLLVCQQITFGPDFLKIYYNNQNNTFTQKIIHNLYDYGDLDIGDIDNDGDIDIAVTLEFATKPVLVLYNDGLSFSNTEIQNSIRTSGKSIKLNDIDADHDLDIIFSGSTDDIYILKNVDNFVNDRTLFTISVNDLLYFITSDFNNDNKIDIAYLSKSSSSLLEINILQGDGTFNFTNAHQITNLEGSSSYFFPPNMNYLNLNLVAYDVDNDGLKDLIYKNGFSPTNSLIWFKNTTMTTATSEYQLNNNYKLFPNPVFNFVNINYENLPVEQPYYIKTVEGKIILDGTSTGGKIEMSSLQSGIYFLLFKNAYHQFKILKVQE